VSVSVSVAECDEMQQQLSTHKINRKKEKKTKTKFQTDIILAAS
jgi:hypothetical protein